MMLRTFTLLSKTFSSVKAPSCSNFSVSGYNLYSTDHKIRFYIHTQNGFNPFLTEHFKFYRPVFLQEISSFFLFTGKPLSEALILASINPQYDKRLFTKLQAQYMKIARLEHVGYSDYFLLLFWHSERFMYTTCSEHVLSLQFLCNEVVIHWTICRHIVAYLMQK